MLTLCAVSLVNLDSASQSDSIGCGIESMGHKSLNCSLSACLPYTTGRYGSRLCENVLEHVFQSEPERKSRSYVKFRSADTRIIGRFYVATQTPKQCLRFYTAWVVFCRSPQANIGQERTLTK